MTRAPAAPDRLRRRFDRTISLGHLFTATSIALGIAVPLVIWGGTGSASRKIETIRSSQNID